MGGSQGCVAESARRGKVSRLLETAATLPASPMVSCAVPSIQPLVDAGIGRQESTS